MSDKLVTVRVAREVTPTGASTRFRVFKALDSDFTEYSFRPNEIVSVEDAPMEEPPQGSVVLDRSSGGDVYHRTSVDSDYESENGNRNWFRTGTSSRYTWSEVVLLAGGEQNLKVLDIS